MTIELWMLVYSAILLLVQNYVPAFFAAKELGVGAIAGNRDDLPQPTGMQARALRASNNLKENLPLFAIAVIVAHLAGISNGLTVLGAQLFLGGRIVHVLSYLTGISLVRTLAHVVALGGTITIAVQIFIHG